LKLGKVMAVPTLLLEYKIWTSLKQQERRREAADIIFF
jgi:hypothetical protein